MGSGLLKRRKHKMHKENIQMNKESGIICSYKGVKKDDPEVKTLIEGAGNIYDSTFISS